MMNFLKEWLEKDENVGKPFKYAYNALKENVGADKLTISAHGCYKYFSKNSGFSYTKI